MGTEWGQQTDIVQTSYPTEYYIDLNNLLKLDDVNNAYELAVVEASSSHYGLMDYII